MPRNLNGRFNGNWNAVQRANLVSITQGLLGTARLLKDAFRLDIDKRIEHGIDRLDALNVLFRDFDWRNGLRTDIGSNLAG
jgi:hypothetical protein